MKTRLLTITAVAMLAVSAVTMPGCESSDIRDTATREVERLDERLDTIDTIAAYIESAASDDQPISVLPQFVRDALGRVLPAEATIADARAYFAAEKGTVLAGRQQALDHLASIQDDTPTWAAGLTAGGSIAELLAPLFGPYGVIVAGVGGLATAIGKRFGMKKGAQAVAANINAGRAADSTLRAAFQSGVAHDTMKASAKTLPKAVQVGIKAANSA
jgi:hypothetical protein